MLVFELFPAFVALVSVIVGVFLWRADKRAQTGPNPEPLRRSVPPPKAGEPEAARPVGRPSLRA